MYVYGRVWTKAKMTLIDPNQFNYSRVAHPCILVSRFLLPRFQSLHQIQ